MKNPTEEEIDSLIKEFEDILKETDSDPERPITMDIEDEPEA